MLSYGDGFRKYFTFFNISKVTVLVNGNGFWCDLVTFFKRNKRYIKSDGRIDNVFYVHENRYRIPTVTVFNRHK